MLRTKLMAGFFAAGLLALTGCGGGGTAAPTPSAAEPTETHASGSASTAPAEVPETLKFTGTTVDGKTFDGASLAGKPVVLWFWAPWCPKCKAAAPHVEAAAKANGDVHVIGVGGLGKSPEMQAFVKDNGLSIVNLADDAGDVWKKFGVTQQDTFVLIDGDGTVVHKGGLSKDEIKTKVGELA
ncbi:MAG: redoxin family protein [Micromonosporaceae bacterium]